ncbi:MAG TPA: phage tail tape measure protein, partial [Clostridium sp.]|uniref:phage tail tape measure protein n=1 Tax=Clostridium sp. TaxID=1506 RepID=UPI002F936CFA
MSDMIQINIQAILSEVSQKKILTDIQGIQAKINGDPLILKVTTDSTALNALTSKIQTLNSEANKAIRLNIDSSSLDKTSEKFKIFTTSTGEQIEKISSKTREFTDSLGRGVKEVDTFKTLVSKAGDYTTVLTDRTRSYTDTLKIARNEADKLANAIGRGNERSQLARASRDNAVALAGNTAVNNASDQAYVQAQRDEQSRLRAHQEASDTARRMTANEEAQRVATTTSAQRQIEQSILGSNETIAQAQTRMNSSQANGNRYEEMYLQAAREREVLDTRNAETARQTVVTTEQETAELRRQIGLYQERNALAIRNIQASGGSLAQTPAVQSQIGAVQGTVAGLSSSVLDADGFRTQTASINTSMSRIRTGINEARVATQGFGADLVNNGIKMAQWTIVGGLIFGTLSKIKEGFTFINTLDKSMTNIQMITGITRDSVMEMTKAYADLASQLHSTTAEVMASAEEFLRAGHTQEETLKLIQSSTVMGAIAGQDSKSSADQLIAITNGFKMNADEAMTVVDKLTTVDNMSATSTKELGTALERTSVSAQMAGTSFSDLVSYIGTVSSVSRKSASSIGESFKTMFARFQDVKGGKKFDADNEDVSNVERDFQKYAKISVRETSGEFKDFSAVINELSGKWNTLSQVEQSATAKALAGTRQRENFLILMNNMDTALKLQSAQLDSSGSAMTRYGEFAKSTEAKLNDLTNATQKIWLNLLSSTFINSAIGGLTSFVTAIGNVTTQFGFLNTAIFTALATMTIFQSKAIIGAITSMIELGASVLSTSAFFGGVFPASLAVASTGLRAFGASMLGLLTNPIVLAVVAVSALTYGLVSYANQQAKVKQQLEESNKAQADFNTSLADFQNTLDPKKIDDATVALEAMKKAMNYDENQKQIQKLKEDILVLQSMGNITSVDDYGQTISTDNGAIEAKQQALAVLEGKIKSVDDAQQQYNVAKKEATALDYGSVQADSQKIALKIRENAANGQLITSYQKVADKLVKGNKLTEEESSLNQKMIDKYPEYSKVMNDKTSAIGVNIDALKANQTAQEALATIELSSLKSSAEAHKLETQAIIDATTKRIAAIGAEVKALEARNAAYASQIDKGGNTDQQEHFSILNNNRVSEAGNLLATANKMLNQANLTSSAWDTLSNLKASDLAKTPTSGSYTPPNGTGGSNSGEAQEAVTGPYADLIRAAAKQNGISATLLDALVKQESGFRAGVVSPSGAVGLTQLMPGTAKALGVTNSYDPAQNLAGGAKYLKQQLDKFGGDISLALAAYNAGPGAVTKYNGIPPYAETQKYVKTILSDYNSRKTNQTAIDEISGKGSVEAPAVLDNTDALIKEANAQALLTKARSDDLTKEIAQAKSNNDYALTISKSNELIGNQITQINQLNDANNKINAQGAQNHSNWFTASNEQSSSYIAEYNAQSAISQKNMDIEFAKIQKLRQAWTANVDAIKAVSEEIVSLRTEEANSIIDVYKKAVETQKNIAIDAENERHTTVMDHIDAEIKKLDDEANAQDYTKNLDKAQKDVQKTQSEINVLSLDNSIEARAKRFVLEQQLADKQSAIADTQSKHELDLRKQNLEDQKTLEDKKTKDTTTSIEYTYTELINNEQKWATMREDIIKGNIANIKAELTKFSEDFSQINIAQAEKMGQSFQDLLSLMQKVNIASNGISGISATSTPTATPASVAQPAPVANPAPSTGSRGKVHDASTLNVRNSPNGTVIGKLFANEVMEIIGQSGSWYNVKYDTAKGKKTGWASSNYISKFDTGGQYTGSFSGGKLAMLHEKELVLNKIDTSNLLKAINISKSFMSNFKIPEFNI